MATIRRGVNSRANTYPVPGNHEYTTAGAPGYFDYWTSKGRPTGVTGNGYYSFDLGSWHVIALNSQCSAVPCIEGSLQNDFLEQDLASTTKSCIVAYWHHPLFNSGTVHGSAMPAGVKAFWDDLYAAGADVDLERPRAQLPALREAGSFGTGRRERHP